MKFGLKIIGQLPQILALIFKNVSEKKNGTIERRKISKQRLEHNCENHQKSITFSEQCVHVLTKKRTPNSYRLFQPFIMFQPVKTSKTKVSPLSKTVRIGKKFREEFAVRFS